VSVSIPNIKITFTGVATIPATDILQLHSEMETWFEAYYNVEQNETNARTLQREQEQQYRTLQFRVPAVLNMKTVYDVSNQDTSTNRANTVTYTQNLVYEKTSDAQKPEDYVVLPFVDTPYKAQLMKSLKANIASFENLSAISQPEIVVPKAVEKKSLSLPIIIIIVAGGVIGLLLLACCAYALGSRREDRYPVGDGGHHGGGTNNVHNGYNDSDDHDNMLPSTFQMSMGDDDVISTMDDPTVAKLSNTMSGGDASALGGYGDQRYVVLHLPFILSRCCY
jgi:hypothetical protein